MTVHGFLRFFHVAAHCEHANPLFGEKEKQPNENAGFSHFAWGLDLDGESRPS
jgi:hypothetical protein